jgi:hypothetical protein
LKEYFTSDGKRIAIYEKPFKFSFTSTFFNFCKNSLFRIGWSDNDTDAARQHAYMHSKFDTNDVKASGFLEAVISSDVQQEIEGHVIEDAVCNLSTPADSHFAHVHPEIDKVMLYYVNMEWREGWHGETLFYSDDKEAIERAISYVPGQVVVFDASIPHVLRPQSHSCDKYRFTFALMLKKR